MRTIKRVLLFSILCLCLGGRIGFAQSAGVTIIPSAAPAPLMGWNAWPVFSGTVTDANIRDLADAMVSYGLVARKRND